MQWALHSFTPKIKLSIIAPEAAVLQQHSLCECVVWLKIVLHLHLESRKQPDTQLLADSESCAVEQSGSHCSPPNIAFICYFKRLRNILTASFSRGYSSREPRKHTYKWGHDGFLVSSCSCLTPTKLCVSDVSALRKTATTSFHVLNAIHCTEI